MSEPLRENLKCEMRVCGLERVKVEESSLAAEMGERETVPYRKEEFRENSKLPTYELQTLDQR